jgi:hypothetical protein
MAVRTSNSIRLNLLDLESRLVPAGFGVKAALAGNDSALLKVLEKTEKISIGSEQSAAHNPVQQLIASLQQSAATQPTPVTPCEPEVVVCWPSDVDTTPIANEPVTETAAEVSNPTAESASEESWIVVAGDNGIEYKVLINANAESLLDEEGSISGSLLAQLVEQSLELNEQGYIGENYIVVIDTNTGEEMQVWIDPMMTDSIGQEELVTESEDVEE